MKLIGFHKVKDGKYLKNYELTYLNKAGKEKVYEIVSRKEINDISELGNRVNGVSIVAIWEEKLLLLKEFRMGVNRSIYNLEGYPKNRITRTTKNVVMFYNKIMRFTTPKK